jgi:GNAT superfamily N-acetyltransferase
MTSPTPSQYKTWTKDQYHISTDPALIPVQTLNTWFATKEMYWAKPMPEEATLAALQNSLCFGLYHNPNKTDPKDPSSSPQACQFIGIARCITDFTTFVYLTDVFVLPTYQGSGLGKWLVSCVQEVIESMPYLRRSLLFTSDWKRSVPFYEQIMGVEVVECRSATGGQEGVGLAVMMRKYGGIPGVLEASES